MVPHITTVSFRNQIQAFVAAGSVTSRIRKRGIAALLQDVTNDMDDRCTRRARQQAKRTLQKQSSRCAPRGDPFEGAARRYNTEELTPAVQEPLHQQMGDEVLSNDIADTLICYIQRNASYEIQKAIA